jgi:hypothetical protein
MPARLACLNCSGAGALETRERSLETREPSCVARLARPFFIPEARGPQRPARHVAALEPS